MKQLAILGATLSLLLAACGPAQEPTESTEAATPPVEAVTEQAPAEATAETVAEEAPTAELVEESAAEEETADVTDKPIMLAEADTTTAAQSQDWQFKEGTHFVRLVPTQPTVGGADKVEVAEFFWYGCPHCYDFEPAINGWVKDKPQNVRFVRIPAMWNGILQLHAKLYYTEEALARNGAIKDPAAFHEAVFQEYHRRNNRLTSEGSIQSLFERYGVSADVFTRTWNSFEVAQKLRVAEDLARRYSIASVPMIVVNGKYRTGGAEAGSYPKLLEVIDELVARESVR